nr:unnamed protein product [Callosobruchus analis]
MDSYTKLEFESMGDARITKRYDRASEKELETTAEIKKSFEMMSGMNSGQEDGWMMTKKNEVENSEDLEFIYQDCDTHANEIAELYSYTEHWELHLNLTAFEEQMNQYNISHIPWRHFTEQQKSSIILKILDQLDYSDKTARMKSARCILYIAQGGWLGIQSDVEQINCAKESCLLLYKLGTFNAFVDLLNLEIERNPVVNKSSVNLSDSEDLRVILSVLYTITEVIRSERDKEPALYNAFCNEIMNDSNEDLLIITLFNMVTKFCSGTSPHFPIKKILLLIWKLILLVLGGTETLRLMKEEKRRIKGLPSQNEDTIDIARNMRPSSPPSFPADILDESQRRRRGLVKQSSLEESQTFEVTEFDNNEDEKAKTEESVEQFQKWQDVQTLTRKIDRPKLPWKPKVHKKEVDAFLNVAREKFIGYSLADDSTTLFGLPEPIHESVAILKEHTYVSLSEVQIQKEESLNRNPLTMKDEIEQTNTEVLYQAMMLSLPQYMICLLKILLATTTRGKTANDSINILSDVLPKQLPTTDFQSVLDIDLNRHKEIIVKAVSAILILLLKHFKLNHIYQFEFMSQHLVFANCIPLILKFFNQEIVNYVKARNSIPIIDIPSCILSDFQPDINGGIEIGSDTKYCWRNIFSCINLLRVLNKLCKWKNSRIMMLVIFKSSPILKRTLKIRHAMAQVYALKLLKMQAKYLGRNWRKSNLKTVSLIYQKVRHHLTDDWAYGNFLDAKPWDFQSEEITLRTAVDKFNNRRYSKNKEDEFETVDNNLNSVLGMEIDFSDGFRKNYHLWLQDEVYNNEIDWDKLF